MRTRAAILSGLFACLGAGTAAAAEPGLAPGVSLAESVLRLVGGLLFVFGLFLGALWLLKRAPGFLRQRGDARKLQVLEVRSLGPRQALYIVGYERQRYLLAGTPAGVSLLTALPASEGAEAASTGPAPGGSFTDALLQVMQRPG
ncbi:MAG: flagellar biosynthetic protein FliO [Verrucomicrobiota bacterium]